MSINRDSILCPTRGSASSGFNELEMESIVMHSPKILGLMRLVASDGFVYGGDTDPTDEHGFKSKANTDMYKRVICINKDLDIETAALSFAYELRNASQRNEYIQMDMLLTMPRSPQNLQNFLKLRLRSEAASVLFRSEIAIDLNLQHKIVNKRYLDIAAEELSSMDKIHLIELEMAINGKVGGGARRVIDHYTEQYNSFAGRVTEKESATWTDRIIPKEGTTIQL